MFPYVVLILVIAVIIFIIVYRITCKRYLFLESICEEANACVEINQHERYEILRRICESATFENEADREYIHNLIVSRALWGSSVRDIERFDLNLDTAHMKLLSIFGATSDIWNDVSFKKFNGTRNDYIRNITILKKDYNNRARAFNSFKNEAFLREILSVLGYDFSDSPIYYETRSSLRNISI